MRKIKPRGTFFLKILFICLTERQPAREGTQQGSGRGRSRLIEEEPDEPKADAEPLCHPGAPINK